ncbi:MAG: hypothetical protein K1X83_12025 [Oligoflexia bacterium]|nr:hypothetical protein [Oligoflexia bacterium]
MSNLGIRSSLESTVNASFVSRFQGLASSSASSNSDLSRALSGGSDAVTIADGLRTGARVFASAVSNLNSTISVLGMSQGLLEQLGAVTDKMSELAKRASQSGVGSDQRGKLDQQFRKLADDFEQVVKDAKFGDRELLTVQGISEILQAVGLDQASSEGVAKVISEFVVTAEDDALASENVQGPRPVTNNGQRLQQLSAEFDSLFSPEANIRTRGNAARSAVDLKALRQQIDHNLAALGDTVSLLGKNLDLARASGLAFLKVADGLSSAADAGEVARQLRSEIRKQGSKGLSQAENLEPMVVAALAYG